MRNPLRPAAVVLALFCLTEAGFAENTSAAPPSGVRVSVPIPDDGFVSAALFEPGGALVRSLLFAEPVKKGTHDVPWDGTDDLGRPCKPGKYDVKALFFKKCPELNYRMTVGRSGNPPYRTPDGKGSWGSNLDIPSGLATHGDAVMMVFGCVEDTVVTGLQRTDLDGNIVMRYFSFYPWDGRTATAMDGTNIYLAVYNYQKKQLEVAVYEIDNPRGKILAELPAPHSVTEYGPWKNRDIGYSEGMALSETSVYVGVPYADCIFRVNRENGSISRIELPAPRGLVFRDGKLYAVSGKRVVRLDENGKLEKTLVPEGTLLNPSALALDRSGNLYVGDSGADFTRNIRSHAGTRRIHVFSPDGDALRHIGREGGTPAEGRFVKDGFGVVTAMTIDRNDRLWVHDVATGFKRTSRWSADGTLEKQWFTRKLQHESDVVNPGNVNELLSVRDAYDDSPPGVYAYKIDIDAGTWEPSWFYELTFDRMYGPAKGVYESHLHTNRFSKGYPELGSPIFDYDDSLYHRRGRHYMIKRSGNIEGAIHLFGPDAPPKPVAMIGYHHLDKQTGGGTWNANYDQTGPNRWFTWSDANGDGVMQNEELNVRENDPKLAPFKRVAEGRFQEDGSVLLTFVLARPENSASVALGRLRPREWRDNGSPVFNWADLELFSNLDVPDLTGGDGVKTPGPSWLTLPNEYDGNWFGIIDPNRPRDLRLPGIDGDGWWASRNWRKKLARWDKNGNLLWAVGRRAPGRARPGEMYNPIMIGGIAKDCLFVADAMTVTWVWHTDGLFVGRLFPDTGTGYMGPDGIFVEQQGIGLYQDAATGTVYTLVNDTACAVHEVAMPEFVRFDPGSVQLSPEAAAQAVAWDPDGVDPLNRPTFWAIARDPEKGHREMKIDGSPDGREGYFDNRNQDARPDSMKMLLDGAHVGEVRAVYDDANLYLHYSLRLPTPFANAGTELPLCPFTSGAYVDCCLGVDWNKPQRGNIKAGDARILLTRVPEGDAVTEYNVGYWPILPKNAKPETIRSPAAEIKFDRIGEVPGLRVAWKDQGYDERSKEWRVSVEAAIPLRVLGLRGDLSNRSVGFDVSVGIANEQGTQRERAAHWAGASEGIVVDRPGSAKLNPATWGTLRFAPKE